MARTSQLNPSYYARVVGATRIAIGHYASVIKLDMLNQFSRTQLRVGSDGIESLLQSRVAAFGIGGVGGYAVNALTRSGIGTLDRIDDDRVCLTNLNRHLHAIRMSVLGLIIAGEVIKDLTKTWREE